MVKSDFFNQSFPEEFNWDSLDSVIASSVGTALSRAIERELKLPIPDRHNVPGLRKALNILWDAQVEHASR